MYLTYTSLYFPYARCSRGNMLTWTILFYFCRPNKPPTSGGDYDLDEVKDPDALADDETKEQWVKMK